MRTELSYLKIESDYIIIKMGYSFVYDLVNCNENPST
jgi:hypothetical protein